MSQEAPSDDEDLPGKPGRPPHQPTPQSRSRVRRLAKVGSQEQVARKMGFSVETLVRYYADEWQDAQTGAIIAVKTKLLGQALRGSVNAQFKYLQLMGQVRPQSVELTGPNGGPIQHVDLSRLSPEELEEYGRLAAIAEGIDPDSILIEPTGA
jgi:hypothetical protein